MRIFIVGARGQLAGALRQVLADEDVVAVGRQELDICDAARVSEALCSLRPDIVINAAAIRRPDDCEQQPERAFAVNTLGTRNLALACATIGARLLQFSTDNVFDGRKTSPYLEGDAPNPITTYGITKLAGEFFVRSLLEKYYIVRTSGLFGGSPDNATNFVLTMLRQAREGRTIQVATDQHISPTYTMDLALKIAWLIRTEAYGLYHISNAGACSWLEFAQAIFRKADVEANLLPTTTEALKLRAARLRYAVLGNGALQRIGADDLPPWEDALERYLQGWVAATQSPRSSTAGISKNGKEESSWIELSWSRCTERCASYAASKRHWSTSSIETRSPEPRTNLWARKLWLPESATRCGPTT